VSTPYEIPEQADLVLEADRHTFDECVNQVVEFVATKQAARTTV
jgi:adenylylsulfate kinase-like enzyme